MRTITLLVLGILISCASLIAQSETISEIKFTYDDAGNRETREIILYDGGTKSAQVVPEDEEEIDFEKGLNVYPNPASHSIFVTLNEEAMEEDRRMIIVFDNLGKQIHQTQAVQEVNQLDVSTWINGTYILKLIYGNRHIEWIIVKN